MKFSKDKKYVIVADREYHNFLYAFKEKNPFLDIKVLNKSGLLDSLSFTYTQMAIPTLLKMKKWDYSSLKKLMNLLRFHDFIENPLPDYPDFTLAMKTLVDNDCIRKEPCGERILSRREILLFESQEDFELRNFLQRKNLPFKDLTFEDFAREKTYSGNVQPIVYDFDNKLLQYTYVFSDIRKKLLEHPENKNKVTILVKDDKDMFFIRHCSKLFSLPVRYQLKAPLVSDPIISKAVKSFYQNKNFKYDEEDKEALKPIQEILTDYKLDEIDDFSFSYSCFMEILSTKSFLIQEGNSGIQITDSIFFDDSSDKDHLIYVSDFQHDCFYKEFDDNNILSDELLKKIGVNPSYVKTKMDQRKKRNFLLYHPFVFLSRPLLHLQDKIYPSQFLEELNWKVTKPGKYNPDGIYTSKAMELIDSFYQDEGHYPPMDNYRKYDHSFDGIDRPRKKDFFYPSDFDSYFQCPYSYYLERILRLSNFDKDSTKSSNFLGNMIHKIFEDIFTRDYTDFSKAYEDVFQEGIKAYIQDKKDELTVEEQTYIEFVHKWLKDVLFALLRQKTVSNIISENSESEANFTLRDDQTGKEYPIRARIDKIVHSQYDAQKYYTIIDYKTGSSGTFHLEHVFLGGSLQLPIYYFALNTKENQKIISNQTEDFGGFGIQHLYFKNAVPIDSKEHAYDEAAILEKTRISGIASSDLNYLQSFDSTVLNKTKNGEIKLKKKGEYLETRYLFGEKFEDSILFGSFTMEEFLADAKKAALNTICQISQGRFDIKPTADSKLGRNGGQEKCRFCPYNDVCYHDKKDIRDIAGEILERFGNSQSGQSDDTDEEDDNEESDYD